MCDKRSSVSLPEGCGPGPYRSAGGNGSARGSDAPDEGGTTEAGQMARNGTPRVSVVVPTCHEDHVLGGLLREIAAVRPAVHEIVVADAEAGAGTVALARGPWPPVKVVRQTRTGKGNALACGFAAATGEAIVTFDAAGSADPAEIPRFVAALVDGADFVTGSRFVAGGRAVGGTAPGRLRQAALSSVARLLYGGPQTDLCHGYHAFWADLLPALRLPSIATPPRTGARPWGDGTEIEPLLSCRAAAAGARLAEVPSVQRELVVGAVVRRRTADDRRVLRVLVSERLRARPGPPPREDVPTPAAPRWCAPDGPAPEERTGR